MSALPPIVAVVGATASGKSDLALDLAERLGGEIVNTDAMAVYRGMDIGTAKLPVSERRGIEHHLLDSMGVNEPLTVAQFQRDARRVMAEIRARGGVPVLVGGSALYTRAVLDRFEFPGTDEAVRRRLESELAEVGAPTLHQRLAEVDPVAAGNILVDNGRRIVRALEVVEITGRPFSATLPVLEYADPLSVQIGVDIDRPTLDERIERRVEADVRRRVRRGGGAAARRRPAGGTDRRERHRLPRGGGVPRRRAHPRRGTRADRRRHAAVRARQDSWFRKDPRVTWVQYDDPQRLERALAAVGPWARG